VLEDSVLEELSELEVVLVLELSLVVLLPEEVLETEALVLVTLADEVKPVLLGSVPVPVYCHWML
jgi:hypothetical protein